MLYHYLIVAGAFIGVFVLFLVISRTLNGTINELVKLQYFLQKEIDLKKERIVIARLITEQDAAAVNAPGADGDESDSREVPAEKTGKK